jgi:hypothetical protein
MHQFFKDIIDDPSEYLVPILIIGVFVILWSGLSLMAVLSLRSTLRNPHTKKYRRLFLALVPLLVGGFGVWAHLPISLDSENWHLHFDARWLFVLPLTLAGSALMFWALSCRKTDQLPPS